MQPYTSLTFMEIDFCHFYSDKDDKMYISLISKWQTLDKKNSHRTIGKKVKNKQPISQNISS